TFFQPAFFPQQFGMGFPQFGFPNQFGGIGPFSPHSFIIWPPPTVNFTNNNGSLILSIMNSPSFRFISLPFSQLELQTTGGSRIFTFSPSGSSVQITTPNFFGFVISPRNGLQNINI